MFAFLSVEAKATSPDFFKENHYYVQNCEMFVDRMLTRTDAGGATHLLFFIKVQNDKFDGPIVESGFQSQTRMKGPGGIVEIQETWRLSVNRELEGYRILNLPIGNEDHSFSFRGAFFVKTNKNSYYWIKPRDGTQFVIDAGTVAKVRKAMRNQGAETEGFRDAVSTETTELASFHSSNCH
ncbi:MAG: hypothetical protein A2X94_04070 [Bdellovibrionales bacterium GWB1_55_8]|nr:MAG: hypothetical protein A2X94_04070 [Bdellovibrionales bacterium GWB1_55_8]